MAYQRALMASRRLKEEPVRAKSEKKATKAFVEASWEMAFELEKKSRLIRRDRKM